MSITSTVNNFLCDKQYVVHFSRPTADNLTVNTINDNKSIVRATALDISNDFDNTTVYGNATKNPDVQNVAADTI